MNPVEPVTGQINFCVSKRRESARAAFANGLKAAAGGGVVMKLLKADKKIVKSLRQACAWLESKKRRFCLRNCRISVGRKEKFVLSQDEGVFFVRLNDVREDDTEIDHVIVVDACKKPVWDCVEEYGPNMDPSLFDHFAGDDAKLRAVTEQKRLDVHPVGKRDQKVLKTDPENRKEKRIAARRH